MGNHQWRIGAALGLMTLGFLAGTAPARSAAPTGKIVTIDVANADFGTVVAMLERQAGVDVTIRQGDQPFKQVSVHLVDKPLEYALRKIAFSAHARVSRDSDGGYVFEPESSTGPDSDMTPAQPRTAALTTDANSQTGTSDEDAPRHYPAGSLHWQAIVLQHAVPSELLRIMHWDQYVVEPEPFRPLSVSSNQPVLSSTQPGVILPSQLPPGYSTMDNNNYGTGQLFRQSQRRSARSGQPVPRLRRWGRRLRRWGRRLRRWGRRLRWRWGRLWRRRARRLRRRGRPQSLPGWRAE